MLEISGIDVFRGDIQTLWSVSLTVEEGKITALLGPNASGKTTLLMAITGLLRPARGSISLDGTAIHGQRVHRIVEMGISMVPEGRRVFPEMTVLENLELGAYTRNARQQKRQTMEEVFHIFPLLEKRSGQLAGTLSGGERQMLATARGLMARPKILLIDELSLGLAPATMILIAETIQRINKTMGLTIFMVEQNVSMTLEMADFAYILENGRIVGEGTGKDLLHDERVKSAYLGIGEI
jgi:branched-chain amino acid transport system ATP-binding protein